MHIGILHKCMLSWGEVVAVSVYRAVTRRDEDGYWFADFPDIPGCHTQALRRAGRPANR